MTILSVDLQVWPWPSTYLTNVSNGTATPQGEQLCQFFLKSMHKCRSYGPDNLNLCDLQVWHWPSTYPKKIFLIPPLLLKDNNSAKLFWNPCMNVEAMVRTKPDREMDARMYTKQLEWLSRQLVKRTVCLSDLYDVFLLDIVRETRQNLWTMIYRSQSPPNSIRSLTVSDWTSIQSMRHKWIIISVGGRVGVAARTSEIFLYKESKKWFFL